MDVSVPRIKSQKDAAAMMRITPRRLREIETGAPWWLQDMRTDDGYDIVAIAVAQVRAVVDLPRSEDSAERGALKSRELRAETIRAEFLAQEAEIRAWRAQRLKDEEQRNVLPADVYEQFVRELLGMMRTKIESLPFELSRRVPPAAKKYIFVSESQIKKQKDAAPLQRMIDKMLSEFEEWFAADPVTEGRPV